MLGNHTDTHPNLLWLSQARILHELGQCAASIFEATGRQTTIMRPRMDTRGPRSMRLHARRGLVRLIMWSKSARDWAPQPTGRLIQRLQTARAGDIILLHDGFHGALGGDRQQTVQALAHWLPRWKAQGSTSCLWSRSLMPLDF